jgi:hypothetical protein
MAAISEAEASVIKQHPLHDALQEIRSLLERHQVASNGVTEFLQTDGELVLPSVRRLG